MDLTKLATVWACGDNGHGQLGLGNSTEQSLFAQLPDECFGHDAVLQVACGEYFSLALTGLFLSALSFLLAPPLTASRPANNKLFAWGFNVYQQLGLGDSNKRSSPSEVTSLTDKGVVELCCGLSHSLARCGESHSALVS